MISKISLLFKSQILKKELTKSLQLVRQNQMRFLGLYQSINRTNTNSNLNELILTPKSYLSSQKAPKSNESQNSTTVIEHTDFYIEQLFTGCLATYSYYIESNGEAVIIDPLRETKPYLDLAAKRGAKIKYILLTHIHADFVSGHISLANKTKAKIIYGPDAKVDYDACVTKDGEEITFGKAKFKVLHTPGHTTESSCYLLKDSQNKPYSVFSGDTLFMGEVGRPDLAVKSDKITQNDLAGWLYDSTRSKLMTLPDDVVVFPTHGAGSACGKSIGKGHKDTIGNQKKNNYALQPMSREEFIQAVTHELPQPPKYFFYGAQLNKTGYKKLEDANINDYKAIKPSEVNKILKLRKTLILDCRNSINEGFLEDSINIGLNTPFAVWVGTLIDPKTPLILLTDPGQEEQSVKRLMRIGFESIIGYIEGGFEAIKNEGSLKINKTKILNADDFVKVTKSSQNEIIDIRTKNETDKGKGSNAKAIPLAELSDNFNQLPKEKDIYIYCGSGARAKMAVTMLNIHGFKNVTIAKDGYETLHSAGMQ